VLRHRGKLIWTVKCRTSEGVEVFRVGIVTKRNCKTIAENVVVGLNAETQVKTPVCFNYTAACKQFP
jgi:hypothetical protein